MIELYYKDILLGTLKKEQQKYIYTSSDTENLATINYFLIDYLPISNSKNRIFEKLPDPFATMYKEIKLRPDLIAKADIKNEDDEYEVLYKYAGIKQGNVEYSIKQKNT